FIRVDVFELQDKLRRFRFGLRLLAAPRAYRHKRKGALHLLSRRKLAFGGILRAKGEGQQKQNRGNRERREDSVDRHSCSSRCVGWLSQQREPCAKAWRYEYLVIRADDYSFDVRQPFN